MYHQSVASGPSLVSDIYGLPLVHPGCCIPSWIKRRCPYMKKLSPAARNALLTGDPFFAFDNTAYDAEWISSLPPAPVAAPAAPVPPGPVLPPPPAAVALPPVPPVVPPDQDRVPPLQPPHTPHPVDDSFPNVFGSSTLKLLLTVCLILALRDPPVHRLLCRPTLHLQDVFSLGPRLRSPPLSLAPMSPWMAPANLPTGFEAPRTAILQPVFIPPLLPLDLTSLRGAMALPARSSMYSILQMISLKLLDPPPAAPPRSCPHSQPRPTDGLSSRRGPGHPQS
jgi:hypothetical protein